MTDNDPIVIVGAARTPIGNFQGGLSSCPTPALGSVAIRAAVERAGVSADDIDEVFMGCVLPAGLGQAPARQAALGAGLAEKTGCTTLNKVCGSGMKTVMLAHDLLQTRAQAVMVAGGMENMSNAPYLSLTGRAGARLGHTVLKDHMFYDGLEDAYQKDTLMGVFAEATADRYSFTREAQDAFAIHSIEKARKAVAAGAFKEEIAPVTISTRRGDTVISEDEGPGSAKPEKIASLRPAFRKDGTVTAANASTISDGAAALVLMRASEAERRGLKPLAKILGHASHAHEPAWFTTAPVGAVQKLQEQLGLTPDDIDLYEINEAFAVVTMAAIQDLAIPAGKVNVHGGACVLGHPIGASGTRILVSLLYALRQHQGKRGIASLCIGGGEAVAICVELI